MGPEEQTEIEETCIRACICNDVATLRTIFSQNNSLLENINEITNENRFPLLPIAIKSQNLEVIEYLLSETNISTQWKDLNGTNIFHLACMCSNLQLFQKILSFSDEEMINSKNKVGANGFLIACGVNKNIEIIKQLHLNTKIDLNCVDGERKNALFYALENVEKKEEFLEYLLSIKEINWKLFNKNGDNILHAISKIFQLPLLRLVVDKKKGEELIFNALNRTNSKGNTIFHIACAGGDLEVVKFISSLDGLIINQVNKMGLNEFLMACRYSDNLDIIKYLHQHTNVDIHFVNIDKENAMINAILNTNFKGDLRLLQYLLKIGIDYHLFPRVNKSIFFYACVYSSIENAKFIYIISHDRNYSLNSPDKLFDKKQLPNQIDNFEKEINNQEDNYRESEIKEWKKKYEEQVLLKMNEIIQHRVTLNLKYTLSTSRPIYSFCEQIHREITLKIYITETTSLKEIFFLSNKIFGVEEGSSKYASFDWWQELYKQEGKLLAAYYGNVLASFIFVHKKEIPREPSYRPSSQSSDQSSASLHSWHVWLCGTIPSIRGKGLMRFLFDYLNDTLLKEKNNNAKYPTVITVTTTPSVYPKMFRFLQDNSFTPLHNVSDHSIDESSEKITFKKVIQRKQFI